MPTFVRFLLPFAAAAGLGAALPGQGAAAATAPDRTMLPDAALVAIEIADPPAAVEAMLSALGTLPEDLPEGTRAQISLGLAGVAVALGATPTGWAERVAGGGAVVGVMPHGSRQVVVAITRPGDLVEASSWFTRIVGNDHHEIVGEHLLLASKPSALPALRAHLEDRGSRWREVAPAAAAVDGRPALVRAVVDLQGLRRTAGRSWPSPAALDPGQRLLLAPLAEVLTDAGWLRIAVAADDAVRIEAVADATARGRASGALLVAAPRPLPAIGAGTAVALRLERSVHALFADPARVLDEDGVLSLQEFLSIADGLDGPGTSFVDDGLGGLGEPFDLLVFDPPPLDDDEARAPLLLPQFALVTSVTGEQAEAMFTRMVRVFGTIVNAERQQRQQRAFLIRARRGDDGGRGVVAESRAWSGPGRPPLEQHLTPTIWFDRGHVALGSTHEAAVRAIDAACAGAGDGRRGDHLRVRGPALAEVLRANHRCLVLARVLDEGEPADRADRYFRTLAAVAEAIGVLEVSLAAEQRQTRASLLLRRAPAGEPR